MASLATETTDDMRNHNRINNRSRNSRKTGNSLFWKRLFRRPLLTLAGAIAAAIGAILISLLAPEQSSISDGANIRKPDTISRTFTLCTNGEGKNCVVDGDTIRLDGARIRIADIDTPETNPPRCAGEAERGQRATMRMLELLNQGAFAVEQQDMRSEDRYGRQLRILTRNGESLGDILISEGLARPWEGSRRSWC